MLWHMGHSGSSYSRFLETDVSMLEHEQLESWYLLPRIKSELKQHGRSPIRYSQPGSIKSRDLNRINPYAPALYGAWSVMPGQEKFYIKDCCMAIIYAIILPSWTYRRMILHWSRVNANISISQVIFGPNWCLCYAALFCIAAVL